MISSSLGGVSGLMLRAETGERVRTASMIIPPRLPPNACRPVAISYSSTPSENISARASKDLSADLLRRHIRRRAAYDSGDRRRIRRIAHSIAASNSFQRQFGEPKVDHLRLSPLGHKNISGLDVAVTIPSVCAASKASAICMSQLQHRFEIGKGFPFDVHLRSVSPSMNSITMKARPPSSAIS